MTTAGEFRHWTPAEDAFLWAGWEDGLPVDRVAELCGRTVAAVRNRAKARGLKRPVAWTPWADDVLRAEFGKPGVVARDLARRLDKSYGALKQRAARLGLRSYRRWTRAERAALRARYGREDVAAIARDLGKTVRSVYQNAKKLRLTKYPHWPAKVIARVKALNAKGLCDREIAARMGKRPDQVRHIRQRFNLPYRPDRDARRRSIENQRRTCGVKNSGELRAWAFRKFARENGWPESVRPRGVQILNVLAAKGPRTRRELVADLGLTWKAENNGRNNLSSNDPEGSYLAHLQARGLVYQVKRSAPGGAKGRKMPSVYMLTPAAIGMRERWLAEGGLRGEPTDAPAA